MRIVADGANPHGDKKFGKRLSHHSTIGDDVAHTAGHAHVIFEHPPVALLVTDQVDTADLNPHAVSRNDAGRLPVKVTGGGDKSRRNYAVAHRALLAIDVGKKSFQSGNPLLDAGLNIHPFGLRDNAGHGVDGERTLFAGKVEGHPLGEIRAGERVRSAAQLLLGHLR